MHLQFLYIDNCTSNARPITSLINVCPHDSDFCPFEQFYNDSDAFSTKNDSVGFDWHFEWLEYQWCLSIIACRIAMSNVVLSSFEWRWMIGPSSYLYGIMGFLGSELCMQNNFIHSCNMIYLNFSIIESQLHLASLWRNNIRNTLLKLFNFNNACWLYLVFLKSWSTMSTGPLVLNKIPVKHF